jgi:hypothetical protein
VNGPWLVELAKAFLRLGSGQWSERCRAALPFRYSFTPEQLSANYRCICSSNSLKVNPSCHWGVVINTLHV